MEKNNLPIIPKLSQNREPLDKASLLKTQLNLKGSFIKAGIWYLDLIRELDQEIQNWEKAAAKASEKDPKSSSETRYLSQAQAKRSQKERIIKFYEVCEILIDRYEDELWLKEQMETLLFLQIAANKQGKKVDVLESATLIFKKQPN